MGTHVAAVLAKRFPTIDAIINASVKELETRFKTQKTKPKTESTTSKTKTTKEPEPPIVAKSVYDYLHSKFGTETIEDLKSVGVNMKSIARAGGSRVLEGKTLVVTGTLQKYSRDEIEELITRQGGHAASSVSKSTDYVVAGENAGSKLDKAKELGIPVISEGEFEERLMQGGESEHGQ